MFASPSDNESQTVAAVSPVIVGRSQVIAPGGNWRTMINGADTDYQTIRAWQTDSGAFFGPDDVLAARCCASRITSPAMTRTISRSAIKLTSPPPQRAAPA